MSPFLNNCCMWAIILKSLLNFFTFVKINFKLKDKAKIRENLLRCQIIGSQLDLETIKFILDAFII